MKGEERNEGEKKIISRATNEDRLSIFNRATRIFLRPRLAKPVFPRRLGFDLTREPTLSIRYSSGIRDAFRSSRSISARDPDSFPVGTRSHPKA